MHEPTRRGTESPVTDVVEERLVRIQEVAADVGLTPRAIRYYEEMGLLRPAARTESAYRLYDASDVARLRFIRRLRCDAGFSLAEIARLLEDEEARTRARDRFRATDDPGERRALVTDSLARLDRQIAMLREKSARLAAMIEEAEARRTHLRRHLDDLDGAAGTPAGQPVAAGEAPLAGDAPLVRPRGRRRDGTRR